MTDGVGQVQQPPQDCTAIVAIGASAGGLEPLEAFFAAAPTDQGWCFIVIQHLSPDYVSVMDKLLARKSSLTILHIEDGAAPAPNTIFLNPPNALTTLDGGVFRLQAYAAGDTLPHHPIDALFRSLVRQPRVPRAAVILSGSGTDGARGAEALQQAGGHVLVQSPKETKFSSMPRAALSTGAVDRIDTAARLPAALADLFAHGGAHPGPARPRSGNPTEAILQLIETAHRIDFSVYKAPTVIRRIERRMTLRGLPSLEAYRDLLERDEAAVNELYQDMLIGVTRFYRDPDAISALSRGALTAIVNRTGAHEDIRIWVPACATGEEAYTIAIELSEILRSSGRERRFRIIATDVHRPSIDIAANGLYPRESLEGLPEPLRERYFVARKDGYQVDTGLRQKIIFSAHNAIADPPFMRLDLVSCRNLLIYLDDIAQARILSLFLFGLKKDGFLFLGASESLGDLKNEFATVDATWRLFRKASDRRVFDPALLAQRMGAPTDVDRFSPRDHPRLHARPPLTSVDQSDRPKRDRDSLLRGYDALLKRYAPSSILIGDDGEVLTWFGAASAYVDTLSDLADRTIEDIIHPDLQYPINLGMERLRQGVEREFERNVSVGTGSNAHQLSLRVEPLLGGTGRPKFMLVTLRRARDAGEDGDQGQGAPGSARADPAAAGTAGAARAAARTGARTGARTAADAADEDLLMTRIRELERDLRLTDESLQYVTERLETSSEELQASNEELQASNEELQAANEELQASNEELQAVNEELVSLGDEHERRIQLMGELNADTELAFGLLGIGVLILDANLKIKRFTRRCAELLRLVEHDIGRSVEDTGARVPFADYHALAKSAMEGGQMISVEGPWDNRAIRLDVFPSGGQADPVVVLAFIDKGVA